MFRGLVRPLFGARAFASKPSFKTNLQTRLAQLDRLFLTGVTRFHEITGYTEIERIKAELAQLETDVEEMRLKVRTARDNYNMCVAQRSESQREMNELLMRKSTWTPPDLERFTQLYKQDHEIQIGVQQAKLNYDHVETELEEMHSHVGKLIGARYREEQMFSDRIRQASTWGTWILMGINILLFVVVQMILEPWKRRRLVRSFESKVQQMMEKNDEPQKEPIEVPEPKEVLEIAENPPKWSNLLARLQEPELVVRPVEVGALALASSVVASIVPMVIVAVSGR